jgi:hypothetical protein
MKDGQEPRMTADAPMMRLLGLETKAEMSPEKLYRAWRDRVSESHQGAVDETFGYMLRGEPAEMRYLWNHPDGRQIVMRCCGARDPGFAEGVRLVGQQRVADDRYVDRETEEQRRRLGEALAFMNYLMDTFDSAYHVNFDTKAFKTYKSADHPCTEYPATSCDYVSAIGAYIDAEVYPDDRAALRAFIRPENLKARLKERCTVAHRFRKVRDGAERILKVRAIRGETESAAIIVFVDQTEVILKERAAEDKDRILSEIIKALYGYNVTVDLTDGSYSLIVGTGAEGARAALEGARDYREAYERMMARIRPEYHDALRQLMSFDYLRLNRGHLGFFRAEQYQTVGDDETARWGEVNVTFGIGANGHPVANILGRDITALRRESARLEREKNAAAAKDRILSGITKALYGFDLMVNLEKDSFSLIRGTGAEKVCEVFESCLGKPYSEAMDTFVSRVPEGHRAHAYGILGRDVLLGLVRESGHFDTRVLPWCGPEGGELLLEVNAFMAENEAGEPIVNLLGRDVTRGS